MDLPPPSGIVTLLTDFGTADPYVGIVHGAVLRSNARARLVDLCHAVPPQDRVVAALFWRAARGRFPSGTVHVAVVDPGVGTARALALAYAGGCYWLAPDNGVLPAALAGETGAELRVLDPGGLGLPTPSRTFHGRDVFAPIAGWLSGGRYGFRALGRPVPELARGPDPDAPPRVVHADRFGNLLTNVPAAALAGARGVRVGDVRVAVAGTYGEVAVGELLALVNSYDLVEIAVNMGSAAAVLGLGAGTPVAIER